jgi:TetR/AcrR family transcriptional regulator, regulator of autoinduction and epiphytic fitness
MRVASADVSSTQPTLDGRLARSERTRRAIVEALRALIIEGDLRPTAPRVAERAGVSVRTVWQHFEDVEALLIEAGRRDLEIASSYLVPIDPTLPFQQRVQMLVDARSRMYEAMAPVWRAARLHAPFSAQLRINRDIFMRLAREEVEQIFATELTGAEARDTLLDALLVASAWAAWESLRTDQHLDVDAAKRVVSRWLSALCLTAG